MLYLMKHLNVHFVYDYVSLYDYVTLSFLIYFKKINTQPNNSFEMWHGINLSTCIYNCSIFGKMMKHMHMRKKKSIPCHAFIWGWNRFTQTFITCRKIEGHGSLSWFEEVLFCFKRTVCFKRYSKLQRWNNLMSYQQL